MPTPRRLNWNAEGRLASVSVGGQTVETNIYDADGTRLIRRDTTGTTLYLPGQEIRRDDQHRVTGTRYYSFAGKWSRTRTADRADLALRRPPGHPADGRQRRAPRR